MSYVVLALCFLCHVASVSSLPAGKNITLTKLFSIEFSDLQSIEKNIKRSYKGMGLEAKLDSASLGPNATLFRLHRPGFEHVVRSVSLESNLHPGLFLRYKNYKFRMEKAKPTGLFEKDSTFIERNPFGAASIALELFTHPGWFVCHDTTSPFQLRATSKVVRSKEFDEKCVYRQAVQKYHHQITSALKTQTNQASKEKEKEREEVKAAEILNDLVSKEPVGKIVAAKPNESARDSSINKSRILNQGTQYAIQPAPQANTGRVNTQVRPQNLSKAPYQNNQQMNRFRSVVDRMRYLNSLQQKGLPQRSYSSSSQYPGYIPGLQAQRGRYGMSYRPPITRYSNSGSVNYRNDLQSLRPAVAGGLTMQTRPGSMRPGKVINMQPAERNVRPSFRNPANQMPQSTKAPALKLTAVDKQGQPQNRMTSATSKAIGGAAVRTWNGSGSAESLRAATLKEPKTIDPKSAVYGMGDKCISIRFFNKIRKPVKIVSSMKRAGYLVTAETFKLKTIFKHARKDRKVHFYAQDMNDKEDVLLNNNNVVTVIPGPCDLPYRSIYLSRNGRFSNNEIENFLKSEEEKELDQSKTLKAPSPGPQDGFGQWSEFGPCSTTCGTGLQTRSRSCMPGRACLGTTKESRACIHPPCTEPNCVQTYGGSAGAGKCCAIPFIFRDIVYDKCLTHARTGSLWCSTTPNYDTDKSWGFCKSTERRSNMFSRPQGYTSPSFPRYSFRTLVPSSCPKSCYNMCIPGCHATCCSAHALAFPSVSKKKTTVKSSKSHT